MTLFLIAVAAVSAPIPMEVKKSDKAKILGKWQVIQRVDDGKVRGNGEPEKCYWTFKEETLHIDADAARKYKIDETTNPRQLDLISLNGTNTGIYELEGDTLRWLNLGTGGGRPESMKGKGYLIVFKRVKE